MSETPIEPPVGEKSVRPGAVLRALEHAAAAALPDLADSEGGTVHVESDRLELIHRDGRIVKIRARCECGRFVEIECDYPE